MSTIKVDTLNTRTGSGNITFSRPITGLSGSGASLTALNATELTSGTLPMARLSGTLPALNGSALTALNATELTSGTLPIARIADGAITSAKITDSTIVAGDIASDAITTAKIAANAVTTAKIAAGNVSTATVADLAINAAKLADNAVTTAKINANAVTNAKIASGVDAAKLTTGTLPMARLSGTLPALNGSALTNVVAPISRKVKAGSFSTATTGSYSITGVGFQPTFVFFMVAILYSKAWGCWDGVSTSSGTYCIFDYGQNGQSSANVTTGTRLYNVYANTGANIQMAGTVTSFDSDGFTFNRTIPWAPGGTPSETLNWVAHFFK